jgi:DNA gyrase/topoisomerase IV subunit A
MAGRTGGVREYLETGRGRFAIQGAVVVEAITPTKGALVITAHTAHWS